MNDQPSTDQSGVSRGRHDPTSWVGVHPSADDEPRPSLSRPRIVRTALRLVDEQGLAALTMRALATELMVSPMALYNHVRDKEELVDLMVDLMLGEVNISATEGDWLTRLRALVRSYHQVFAAHHQLARVFSDRVRIGPNGLMIIERTIALLLEGGLGPAEASDAFFALFTYAAGFQQMGHIAPLRHGATPGENEYYPALAPERIPAITAVGPHLDGLRRPGRFDYGLDLLLAGLRGKLAAAARGAAAAPQ